MAKPKYALEKKISDNLDYIVRRVFGTRRNKMDRLADIIFISSLINFLAVLVFRIWK